MEDGNDLVARFVAKTTWQTLPPPVQRKVRMTLMDTLGATLVGTRTPVSRISAAYAVDTWPGTEATLLLHGKRASAIGAAFANGYAANGVDIDDCALYTKGHPGAQIFPTALALCEKLALSGQEMMTAMVIGYEVAHRTARIWHDHHAEYQACGSWGSVACAAVASHLMLLPPGQIRHALGIAEYHAPNLPMMRDIDHPAMVKHGIGWGAMNGIISAQLAQRGFTGILSILGSQPYRDWVADIGQHYIMADGVTFKEYACCAWTHAALEAARQIRERVDFATADVKHILVEGYGDAVRLGSDLPLTTEEAQFNLAWPLATFLLDGEVGPNQILEHRFSDGAARAMAGKVELLEVDELTDLYDRAQMGDPKGEYIAALTITLADGRMISSERVHADMKDSRGWDEERVETKFRWLSGHVLEETRIDALVHLVRHFDEVDDVGDLARLVAG